MSLSVKFDKKWEHAEDPHGNVMRHIPAGLVIELPDDLAAAALFEGVARPLHGVIPPDVQRYIDAYRSYVADLDGGVTLEQAEANMAAALASAQANASDAGGDGAPNMRDDPDRTRTVEPIDPYTGQPIRKGRKRA